MHAALSRLGISSGTSKDHHNHFHITLRTPQRKDLPSNLLTESSTAQTETNAQRAWVTALLAQTGFNPNEGEIDMWLIDYPDAANLNTASAPTVLLAQATPAASSGITRTIGVCRLMQNPVSTWASAVNLGIPLEEAGTYFSLKEKREMPLTGKVTLLETPKHGTLKRFADEQSPWEFRYIPEQDYFGHDQATFLVEMGGQKVKLVYFFNIPAEGVPGGTEGYDPYRDKKLCPKGAYWKISSSNGTGNDLATSPYTINWHTYLAGYGLSSADPSPIQIQLDLAICWCKPIYPTALAVAPRYTGY